MVPWHIFLLCKYYHVILKNLKKPSTGHVLGCCLCPLTALVHSPHVAVPTGAPPLGGYMSPAAGEDLKLVNSLGLHRAGFPISRQLLCSAVHAPEFSVGLSWSLNQLKPCPCSAPSSLSCPITSLQAPLQALPPSSPSIGIPISGSASRKPDLWHFRKPTEAN